MLGLLGLLGLLGVLGLLGLLGLLGSSVVRAPCDIHATRPCRGEDVMDSGVGEVGEVGRGTKVHACVHAARVKCGALGVGA